MPFVQSWQLRLYSADHILTQIRESAAGLHKFFPSLPLPSRLDLNFTQTQASTVFVFCEPPVVSATSLPSFVYLTMDNDGHPLLSTRVEYGTCMESVAQHAACLLRAVSFCCTVDPTTNAAYSITYAIEMDNSPCVPFSPQIDESKSQLGYLQKWLGTSCRFIAWTVALNIHAAAVSSNVGLHASSNLAVGINHSIDALSTAKLMLLYSSVSRTLGIRLCRFSI